MDRNSSDQRSKLDWLINDWESLRLSRREEGKIREPQTGGIYYYP